MIIPFKNIDGRNVVSALVEVPDQVFNHFPVYYNTGKDLSGGGHIHIDHIRHNSFTRVFGEAAISFQEQEDKLPIPEAKSNGIYVDLGMVKQVTPDQILEKLRETQSIFISKTEETLNKLGFEKRGPAKYWNPIFGEDQEHNWMDFDPNTDSLPSILPKLFRSGYAKGVKKIRFDIKKALDISLI